jgi:hypothetical protein
MNSLEYKEPCGLIPATDFLLVGTGRLGGGKRILFEASPKETIPF